jgi:hypothetical protein
VRQGTKVSSGVIRAFATAARPNETTSRVSATTFGSNGTTSSSIATAFLRMQLLARPMLLPSRDRQRAGCVAVLSQFSIITSAGMPGHPPADAQVGKV